MPKQTPRNAALSRRAEEAEQTVTVLLEVLPTVIVEAAKDIHRAWLDGRQPDFSEATLTARLQRIVADKFPERVDAR